MGKTFEALERAEKEFQKIKYNTAVEIEEKKLLTSKKTQGAFESSDEFSDLLNKLSSRYANRALRTLLFTGSTHGTGVTITAIQFAKTLVKAGDHRVLIIEANLRTPSFQRLFNQNPITGVPGSLVDDGLKIFKFKNVGKGDLFAFTFGENRSNSNNYLETQRLSKLIEVSRNQFDYIILDTAPIGICPESQAICSLADGVLMVIESGKTRRRVAQRAKQELEDAGGKLLGVVLNKRKYYIPKWIYNRL